jgi:hypothetical protein
MIQRIYIDTSIVGGFFDEEFKDSTQKLFKRLVQKEVRFIISDLLELELQYAPKKVKDLLTNYPSTFFERVEINQDAMDLANQYIKEKVVGKSSLEDCRHIAIATINKVDVVASWNFKHIVNLTRIKGYNAVNLKLGHSIIEIRTPNELINYEDK